MVNPTNAWVRFLRRPSNEGVPFSILLGTYGRSVRSVLLRLQWRPFRRLVLTWPDFTHGSVEPSTMWKGSNICPSAVSDKSLRTSCRVQRAHRTLIDTSKEIWGSNGKHLIPTSGVVAVDPQRRERMEVQRIGNQRVRRSWSWDSNGEIAELPKASTS